MLLVQALKFSQLSTVAVDGCTFAPELGVSVYCKMHDHLLIQLVGEHRGLNDKQKQYLIEQGLITSTLTRKEADILFKEGLSQKVEQSKGISKLSYWLVKWVYYFTVRLRSIIFK